MYLLYREENTYWNINVYRDYETLSCEKYLNNDAHISQLATAYEHMLLIVYLQFSRLSIEHKHHYYDYSLCYIGMGQYLHLDKSMITMLQDLSITSEKLLSSLL